MIQCPQCGTGLSPDSSFCTRCGTNLVRICRRCGAESVRDATYCKACGTNVADAKLGISDQRAREWMNHFWQFAGYADLWKDGGHARTTLFKSCASLADSVEPNRPSLGEVAFALPIMAKDWCIQLVQWDADQVVNGAAYAFATALSVYDLTARYIKRMPYESLSGIARENDNVVLTTVDSIRISFRLQIPRPGKTEKAFLMLRAVTSPFAGSSAADIELAGQGFRREADEYWARMQFADAYVGSVVSFFSEILDKKRRIEMS